VISGAPLREVTHYIWRISTLTNARLEDLELPALTYWDGSVVVIDGKRYILVPEPYNTWQQPDDERLACGHEQPVRSWGKRQPKKWYSRRRRCIACALEAL
jgi:hypothetical protein